MSFRLAIVVLLYYVPSLLLSDLSASVRDSVDFYMSRLDAVLEEKDGYERLRLDKIADAKKQLLSLKETDTAYELEIEMPGFGKNEIKVSLENGYLTVSPLEQRYLSGIELNAGEAVFLVTRSKGYCLTKRMIASKMTPAAAFFKTFCTASLSARAG